MAVGDKYNVHIDFSHDMIVSSKHEMMMSMQGMDPTNVNDVASFFQSMHCKIPEMAVWHVMKMRNADHIMWPLGARLVSTEVIVTGPI